jgi:hypothetical protein
VQAQSPVSRSDAAQQVRPGDLEARDEHKNAGMAQGCVRVQKWDAMLMCTARERNWTVQSAAEGAGQSDSRLGDTAVPHRPNQGHIPSSPRILQDALPRYGIQPDIGNDTPVRIYLRRRMYFWI